ncbi:MAG: amidohydrolase family protein [Sphingomonas sp.]|uniref:amidohydrolase family protein n=1 Tax=Sphingomonas sp. TaxID=28214 RepID=UPI003F7F7356
MTASIVRSSTMFTKAIDRHSFEEIASGAILQEDGIILETGTYEDLARRYPNTPVHGSGNEVMLPGFVNGHHHVGLTPVQLGCPDLPLELWFAARMVARNIDFYLDTLYSAFDMISSGITTVAHIQGGPAFADLETKVEDILKAYEDVGMRVSYSFMLRDQNRLVYQADEDFIAGLPAELRGPTAAWFARSKLVVEDQLDMFKSLFGKHAQSRRKRIQLAPANLHWCSDHALTALGETSRAYNVPMHMHLLETQYQKEYAKRRGNCTAVEYLDRFGLLGPNLTLGHGVWLSERDIDRVAETGTCVCHNCSSNFRLRSGIAPLNAYEARGVNTAIGLDEAGINDDRDMLQEMRLVLRANRVPGMDEDDVPGMGQVLRMATVGGARTTPFGEQLGTLEPGRAADLSLIDWHRISWPYLDTDTPTIDAVIQRAKSDAVRLVMCDGEVIYRDRFFTRVDQEAALTELHAQLAGALSNEEVERRKLSKALLPYVRKFYADYLSPHATAPFDQRNAR